MQSETTQPRKGLPAPPCPPRPADPSLGQDPRPGLDGTVLQGPLTPFTATLGPKPGSTAHSLSDLGQAAQPLGATDSLRESKGRDKSTCRSGGGSGRGGGGGVSVHTRTTRCPGSDSLASLPPLPQRQGPEKCLPTLLRLTHTHAHVNAHVHMHAHMHTHQDTHLYRLGPPPSSALASQSQVSVRGDTARASRQLQS